MVSCAVISCKNRSGVSNLRDQGISYHTFPKDPVVAKKWRKKCGRPESWVATRASCICSEHFTKESFKKLPNNRRVLFEGSLPTLGVSHSPVKSTTSQGSILAICNTTACTTPLMAVKTPLCLNLDYDQGDQSQVSKFDNTSLQEDTPRVRNMRSQLYNKNKKIGRLQAKNSYLKKKVFILSRLLKVLNDKLMMDSEDKIVS